MTTKFTVVLPDGTTATRTSLSKRYTYAVAVPVKDRWIAASWHSSQALAWSSEAARKSPSHRILPTKAEDRTPKTRLDERTKKVRRLKTSITKQAKSIAKQRAKAADPAWVKAWGGADRVAESIASSETFLEELRQRLAAIEAAD